MTQKKNRKIRILSIVISAVLLVGIFPVAVYAASCENCGVNSDYTVEYEYWTDTYHTIRHWCDNCGKDQNMGGVADRHSFSHYSSSYDRCDDCGYKIACECDDGECSHDYTCTEWDDCDWYEYCEDCGEEIDSGTEHGETEYNDWKYYSTTRHRRFAYCVDCNMGEYEYARHDAETEYYSYDDYEHEIVEYCADCDEYLSEGDYEEHSFYYGAWKEYSDTEHRRRVRCEYCDYSEYEYEDHDLTYTSWKQDTISYMHTRTAECSCGYSTTETTQHEYLTQIYTPYSGTQHMYSIVCECGAQIDEIEDHADIDDDGICNICYDTVNRFSVTLPAMLTLIVAEDGRVYAAASAMIENNSTGEITVTDITISAENGWTIVPFETNMADEKVNTKLIGFRINGSESTADGDSEDLTLYDEWNIAADDILPLDYAAVVSALSEPIDEQVLTIVFIVGWA